MLQPTALRWPCLTPGHAHFVAKLGMVCLELSWSLGETHNNSIHGTSYHTHHDGGEQKPNEESQSANKTRLDGTMNVSRKPIIHSHESHPTTIGVVDAGKQILIHSCHYPPNQPSKQTYSDGYHT